MIGRDDCIKSRPSCPLLGRDMQASVTKQGTRQARCERGWLLQEAHQLTCSLNVQLYSHPTTNHKPQLTTHTTTTNQYLTTTQPHTAIMSTANTAAPAGDETTTLSKQYDTPLGLAHTTMQALKDRIKLHYDLASDYYLNLW